MKKITRRSFITVCGAAAAAMALTACGGSSSTASSAASGAASSEAASTAAKLDKIKVAVPNDTTNEARALTLLEKNGFFKLKADAGLTATKNDIEENPLNVNVDEVEAAQVPNVLQDEDYAVINSNYAISAGLDPMTDALAMEDGTSAYVNILVCKDGNQEEPKIKALAAALQSQKVKDFMDENYKGAVVSVVENPTDGYDSTVDYDALNGQTVSCAATPAPHCEVLEICKEILAAKGITALVLDIDNTLTADRSQELPEEVAAWLAAMRKAGVKLTIVSNGAEKRVRPFAEKLGLAYLYRSAKPLPFALGVARRRMQVKRREMAMVGDQLYADRMVAALYGIPGLMVIPRGPDLGAQVILKRKWEKKHWQKYYDRGGKTL